MLLEKAKIWKHVEKEIATPINSKLLVIHVKEAMAKIIILE
jgi:hypothetical protein